MSHRLELVVDEQLRQHEQEAERIDAIGSALDQLEDHNAIVRSRHCHTILSVQVTKCLPKNTKTCVECKVWNRQHLRSRVELTHKSTNTS